MLSASLNQSKSGLEAGIHPVYSLLGPHQAESFKILKERNTCEFIVTTENKS